MGGGGREEEEQVEEVVVEEEAFSIYCSTGWSRQLETTFLGPASEFLSTH